MPTTMTDRDEAAGATAHRYHHTRVVKIAERTVRARVERYFYFNRSLAIPEVLNDQLTWTSLAADARGNWWHDTPTPTPGLDTPAVTILGPLTEKLLHRAAAVLTSPPTTQTLSPHVHGAISALLATSTGTQGCDENCCFPDPAERSREIDG